MKKSYVIKVPDAIDDACVLVQSCNLPSIIIANKLAYLRPSENIAIIDCGPTGLLSIYIALGHSARQVVCCDQLSYLLAKAVKKTQQPLICKIKLERGLPLFNE